MTAEQIRLEPAASLTIRPSNDGSTPVLGDKNITFVLEDDPTHPLLATRPKMAVIMRLMVVMGNEDKPLLQVLALNDLLDKLVDADSAEYLRGRLEDDDDSFDYIPQKTWNEEKQEYVSSLSLMGIFSELLGLWYGGPTGGPSGSVSRPKRTGKSSTVKRRSKG